MKRTIILAAMATVVTTTCFAQKDKPVQAPPAKADTLTINASKTAAIVLDGVTVPVADLGQFVLAKKTGLSPLYVSPDWLTAAFRYFRTSRNADFTSEHMDLLIEPFAPYLRSQQPASPGKP